MNRNLPNIKSSIEKGYAAFLAAGFDTLVESFNMAMPDELIVRLQMAKERAADQDKRGKGVTAISIGGETMQIKARGGSQGTMWVAHSPDFEIDIRSPKTEWNISVRYSAAGLWQYGVDELRQRVTKLLLNECYPITEDEKTKGKNWRQISSAHIAFDFYSPKFTEEMRPEIISRFVCHSSSKKHLNFSFSQKGSAWGRADYLETVTVGSKKTIEVQLYDKGKEITEVSGKSWMFSVWQQNGYLPPDSKKAKDVWRLEIRFGKDFLNNRDIKTFEDFDREADKLIAEALFSKRLTAKSTDPNMRRRPLHQLFAIAHEKSGAIRKMLPIGKTSTLSDDQRYEILKQQAAGITRRMSVLKVGDADDEDVQVTAQRIYQHAVDDPEHEKKTAAIQEKTIFKNTAR